MKCVHLFSALLLLGTASAVTTAAAQPKPPASNAQKSLSTPMVKHTGTAPTGYEVTFRYKDATATRVQIKGEWYFADPTKLAPSSTFTNTIVTPALLPKDWKPGFFPIQSPNNNGANFPVTDMTKGPGGVWTYTTPLPSGWFNYSFYVNCAGPTQAGCKAVSDPGNLPWNQTGEATIGSKQTNSQVYVPSDPAFGTIDYSWQAPSPTAHGKLAVVSYHSPISLDPKGENYLAVYTPPGSDPQRSAPYPTLYLAHGAGENEMAWSTQGVAGNILDNLIATGQISPLVVIMPSGDALPGKRPDRSYDQEPYNKNLIDTIIPFVESHYNVSKSASDRAVAGLSQGSGIANSLLLNHTGDFAFYGSLSRGPSFLVPLASGLTAQQIAAIKQVKGIFVGAGWEERGSPYTPFMFTTLASIGAPVTPDFVHGGHEWYVWRILLRDFVTKVAFRPPVNQECPQCVGPN